MTSKFDNLNNPDSFDSPNQSLSESDPLTRSTAQDSLAEPKSSEHFDNSLQGVDFDSDVTATPSQFEASIAQVLADSGPDGIVEGLTPMHRQNFDESRVDEVLVEDNLDDADYPTIRDIADKDAVKHSHEDDL